MAPQGNAWARWLRRIGLSVAVLLALAVAAAFLLAPGQIDRRMNQVVRGAGPPSERAVALLRSSTVIDLHADPLIWGRDLLERHDFGQVDLPRLIEGHVALQVIAAPTKTPLGINFESNPSDAADMMTPLFVLQRWPVRTWGSLLQRALHQAARLDDAAARSEGRLRVVTGGAELDALLEARGRESEPVGSLLAIEGLHALEGRAESVDVLFDAGFRMMGLAHFFDNEAAGSSAGEEKYGLTDLGRRVITRMQELGIAVDLAHAAPAAIRDTLAIATRPVVVSHTGVKATCPGPRNLSDEEVLAIAENGGVIGIAYFAGAVCDASPRGIVRAMRHVRDLTGVPHVGLGSDFDGSIRSAFDTSGLAVLVDALLRDGWTDAEIRAVLGGNVQRVLRETLPR